uniref:cell wall-binding repeat-containing protein n=1 Tax=Paenisporosarcina sp. TG20 TaxID=1211706 RepID=UPI00035DCB05
SKTDENVTEVATYSGFDNSIISVDKGNVSAIAEGTTEITVTYEDVVTIVQVKVNKADVITLSVNPSSVNLKEGETQQLSVIQTLKEAGKEDVLTDVTEDATYVIADDAVVSVSKGKITAKVVGTTSITVTYGDNSETVLVTIEQTELVVDRIYGEDRIKTAIAISKEGWDTASTVILAHGFDFPDALAASPLAYQLDAPILLTRQKSLAPETIEELKRLKTNNVIIVGGDIAVSKTIDANLQSMGISVERIDGENRFDTAAKIAKRLGGNPHKAIVTDGFNFPDALSISSYAAQNGYPILLTRSDRLPTETKNGLKLIPNTIVMGGNLAVSDAVFKQLNNPVRIKGDDRYATAVAVIDAFKLPTDKVYVATGQGFADALTGSVLAAKNGAPIILVRQNSIPAPTAQLIEDYDIRNFTLLGGEVAISSSLFQ